MNKVFNTQLLLVVAGILNCGSSVAQDQAQELEHVVPAVEEIIVTSALHRSRAETVLPVNVLAGEELREKAAATLGEMLQDQVGVNNASFGVGVGLPVIRGQSANRVQVLQGGVGNVDASAVSPDHANSLEPSLAERIEVVRGPATLLYGNGAIGGVVNVIDNRIPSTLPDGLSALVETRHNNAADQQTSLVRLDGGGGALAWHFDAVDRRGNDTRINGFAIDPSQVDLSDVEALDELLRSRGRLQNSRSSSDAQSLGLSWLGDRGYLGVAVNDLDSNYGIPMGAHVDHGHEADEPDSEIHDNEHEIEEERIRIDMDQTRYDIEGEISLNGGLFSELHGKMSVVDYRHQEVSDSGVAGTVFENEGLEGRFIAHLGRSENREGVIGLQFGSHDFAAVGAEAFIPPTAIQTLALFSLQSMERGDFTLEAGLRVEQLDLDQRGSCDDRSINFSGSLASIWRASEDTNLLLSLNHSARAATVEERYSNIDSNCQPLPANDRIAHAATQRLEIGNPGAKKESSDNLELAWRKHTGAITGEVNLFYNRIANYLYLADTGVFNQDVEIAEYRQRDARFHGFELQLDMPLFRSGDHISRIELFADYVDARFDGGGAVPRIPPLRAGAQWTHSHINWLLRLRGEKVWAQSDHAVNETRTAGYYELSMYGDYHVDFVSGAQLLLFARAGNLLDERIRQHTSLLKSVAPAPGRALEVGIRIEF